MTLENRIMPSQRLPALKECIHRKGFARILEAHSGLSGIVVENTRVQKNGVSIEYETKSIAGIDDLFEIVPFLSWNLTDTIRFDVYASAGLTDSAPDFSAGVSVRLSSF